MWTYRRTASFGLILFIGIHTHNSRALGQISQLSQLDSQVPPPTLYQRDEEERTKRAELTLKEEERQLMILEAVLSALASGGNIRQNEALTDTVKALLDAAGLCSLCRVDRDVIAEAHALHLKQIMRDQKKSDNTPGNEPWPAPRTEALPTETFSPRSEDGTTQPIQGACSLLGTC